MHKSYTLFKKKSKQNKNTVLYTVHPIKCYLFTEDCASDGRSQDPSD